MNKQISVIREALIKAHQESSEIVPIHHISEAIATLTQLEAMVGEQEPKFWYRPVGDDGLYEGPVHHNSIGGKMLRDEKPGEWVPLFEGAAPVAQQYEAGDVASAAAQGFRDGVASVAKQRQAPTESVLIDGIAYNIPAPVAAELLRLHIDAKQPQAEAVPTIYVSRGQLENLKPDPEDEAGTYLPVRKTPKGKFMHPLFAAPQHAEAVPPGYVLAPLDVLKAASESLGSFVSDQGWTTLDMQAMDNIDAILAQQKGQP